MVHYCVAFGCKNFNDSRKKISFHTFPFKRPEILEAWIEAIRRENWKPSKSSRICSEHFLANDFHQPWSTLKMILKPDAVPSVFPFNFPVNKESPLRKSLVEIEVAPMDTDNIKIELENFPSISEQSKQFVDKETQTPAFDNKLAVLRRQVKTLRNKVKRKDLKISSMKNVIKKIKGGGNSDESLDSILENYFGGD